MWNGGYEIKYNETQTAIKINVSQHLLSKLAKHKSLHEMQASDEWPCLLRWQLSIQPKTYIFTTDQCVNEQKFIEHWQQRLTTFNRSIPILAVVNRKLSTQKRNRRTQRDFVLNYVHTIDSGRYIAQHWFICPKFNNLHGAEFATEPDSTGCPIGTHGEDLIFKLRCRYADTVLNSITLEMYNIVAIKIEM